MAEISRLEKRSIVMLKVSLGIAQPTVERMNLAAPLTSRSGDPVSYWYGPDCWYLSSDTRTPQDLVDECENKLDGLLHNAVDYSASLAAFRVAGDAAGDVLASGTGIDLRPSRFPSGSCNRTQLAGIGAMITACDAGYELFVDRSYARYMEDWLNDTVSMVGQTRTGQESQ